MLTLYKLNGVRCPQCGSARKASVWREMVTETNFNYYLRCKQCKRRWLIVDMGVDSCE